MQKFTEMTGEVSAGSAGTWAAITQAGGGGGKGDGAPLAREDF